jgi:hypothetical protein
MVLRKNDSMNHRDKIEVELTKLVSGGRLLRLTYPPAGLSLEQKLDPDQAVASQKERLFRVFEAALAQADLLAA